jgi:hypothetical protein
MLINEIFRILAQVRFQGYPLFCRIFGRFSAGELSLKRLQIEDACFDGLAHNEFQGVVQ